MGKRETVYEVAYSTRLSLPISWLLAGTSRISRWALTSCVCQRGAGEGDLPGGRPMYQSESHTPNPRFKSTSDCYRMRLPNRDVRSRRNCRMPATRFLSALCPVTKLTWQGKKLVKSFGEISMKRCLPFCIVVHASLLNVPLHA